jgi:hypothetical protein
MSTASTGHVRVSELLTRIASAPGGDTRVRLGDLLLVLGERAYGVMMLILSLPNAFFLGSIPGLSTVFGVPQMVIAAQMMFGQARPWLPQVLLDRSIAKRDFQIMVVKALPTLIRVERVLKPRWMFFTSPLAERAIGVAFLVLAAIVSLPIPLGNGPPAIAMALIALGLIEQDGVFVVIGLVAGMVSVAIALAVVLGGAALIWLLVASVLG